MEQTMLRLPAHFSSLEQDELVYVDGGWLSDQQSEILLWSASALLATVSLMPNVYLYVFNPILSPITSAVESVTDGISSFVSSIFKSIFG
jgi:hypothetical protein